MESWEILFVSSTVPLHLRVYQCTTCTAAGRVCPSSTRFSVSGTSLSKTMRWGRSCSGCTRRSRTQDSVEMCGGMSLVWGRSCSGCTLRSRTQDSVDMCGGMHGPGMGTIMQYCMQLLYAKIPDTR